MSKYVYKYNDNLYKDNSGYKHWKLNHKHYHGSVKVFLFHLDTMKNLMVFKEEEAIKTFQKLLFKKLKVTTYIKAPN